MADIVISADIHATELAPKVLNPVGMIRTDFELAFTMVNDDMIELPAYLPVNRLSIGDKRSRALDVAQN